MESMIINFLKNLDLPQVILIVIIVNFFYSKIKNQINGLGIRFDKQFGEYKDKKQEEINQLKERIYKLEVEFSCVNHFKPEQKDQISSKEQGCY